MVRQSQAITFQALTNRLAGDSFEVTATANSGLPVAYAVAAGPATLDGNRVNITGAGQVVIRATQPGNNLFDPAPSVDQSFSAAKRLQTITLSVADHFVGSAPFLISASASSGLPVTITQVSGRSSMWGDLFVPVSAGRATLRAEQPGNAIYEAAPAVERSFMVVGEEFGGVSSGTASSLRAITYGNGRFVTVGDSGTILTSPDGLVWAKQQGGAGSNLRGIAFNGTCFAAVGDGGTVLRSADSQKWLSLPPSSQDWASHTRMQLTDIAAFGSEFVGVSTDPTIKWAPVSAPIAGVIFRVDCASVDWYGQQWYPDSSHYPAFASIAVDSENRKACACGSYEDQNWQTHLWSVLPCTTLFDLSAGLKTTKDEMRFGARASRIAYGAGRFVTAGEYLHYDFALGGSITNGMVGLSLDGVTWQYTNQVAFPIEGINYTGSKFWAVGQFGAVYTSTAGSQWTERYRSPLDTFYATIVNNDVVVVVGANGTILTSYYATKTILPPVPVITSTEAATGKIDTNFGYRIAGTQSPVLFSVIGLPDGLAVDTTTGLISGTPKSAGIFPVTLVAANAGGGATKVLTLTIQAPSPSRLTDWSWPVDGAFRLRLHGEAGASYRLQASANLVDWTTLTNYNNVSLDLLFTDPEAKMSPYRFYRSVSP